ncbi:MAG: class I SAM-dependent methyltransferase [Acetobacteraceae bacterium]
MPITKSTYYKLFRLQLRMRIWSADRRRMPQSQEPVPPAILRFRVIESLSVDKFLRIGAGGAKLIERHASDMGLDLSSVHRVLEFGCGCGRTIRWFLRDGGNTEFHGVDVDADAVDWCCKHLNRGHFLTIAPIPPLPYPSAHFDFVYCLSVFTHLDEPMQDIWLAELGRVLKPGGVLLLTIYGSAASRVLDAEGQHILQTAGFVHRRSQKLRGLVPDWYHTTWHSREYIVNRLAVWLGDIHYFAVPDGQQDFVAGRKADPERAFFASGARIRQHGSPVLLAHLLTR